MKTRIIALGIFLLAATASASHEVFYNALGILGGKHALGYEYRPTPLLGAYAKARYEDWKLGAVTSLLYPTNIERMYSASGVVGTNIYPLRNGFYISPEAEGGYHAVALRKSSIPEPDSSEASGPFYAASLRGGYEYRSRWNLSFSPEVGLRYVKNFTDYQKLSEMPSMTRDPMPFELNKKGLEEENNGVEIVVSLLLGYSF